MNTLFTILLVSGVAIAAPKKHPGRHPAQAKGKTMIAVFETSLGKFKAKLFDDKAPKTVANFVGLAEGTLKYTVTYTDPKTHREIKNPPAKPGTHYYDGLTFHRIIDGFMIQGGDPSGTGTGGPGFTIKDEVHPELKHDKPFKLSMAKTSQPDSAGSQFFITVGPAGYLDGTYTQFGEVIEGQDVVTKISKVPVNHADGDRPETTVTIKTIRIERN